MHPKYRDVKKTPNFYSHWRREKKIIIFRGKYSIQLFSFGWKLNWKIYISAISHKQGLNFYIIHIFFKKSSFQRYWFFVFTCRFSNLYGDISIKCCYGNLFYFYFFGTFPLGSFYLYSFLFPLQYGNWLYTYFLPKLFNFLRFLAPPLHISINISCLLWKLFLFLVEIWIINFAFFKEQKM